MCMKKLSSSMLMKEAFDSVKLIYFFKNIFAHVVVLKGYYLS